jgi:hypothetical protein
VKAVGFKIFPHVAAVVGFMFGNEDGFHAPMIAERCSKSVLVHQIYREVRHESADRMCFCWRVFNFQPCFFV